MPTRKYLQQQLERLGTKLVVDKASLINALCKSSRGLKETYGGDASLYREVLSTYGGDSELIELDDETLQFEMPLISGLTFAEFYDGWQEDMPNVSPEHVPFASDDY